MALFFLGRLTFAVVFLPEGAVNATSFGEFMRVMALATRLDLSAVTMLCLPVLLVALAGLWSRLTGVAKMIERILCWAALALVTIGCLAAHFFYFYYKDRFNVFFWEFWNESENAWLVISSLPDEMPMGQVAAYLLITAVLAVALWRTLATKLKGSLEAFVEKHLRTRSAVVSVTVLVTLFVAAAARGTLVSAPLIKQANRQQASAVQAFNALHANPFYDVALSWRELNAGHWNPNVASTKIPVKDAENAFASISSMLPNHKLELRSEELAALVYQAPGERPKWLKKSLNTSS